MTCAPHHAWVAGNLTRTCLSNATWDGVEPVCEGEILINSYNQERKYLHINYLFKNDTVDVENTTVFFLKFPDVYDFTFSRKH